MSFLYYCALSAYTLLLQIAALMGHTKAKHWINGRKNWHRYLLQWRQKHPAPILWMHCASLGEFEQGRPLLEALRTRYPHHQILLSFFSPSGYERLSQTPLADHVIYLPADTWGTAQRFMKTLRPDAAFFVKYEFWYGYLKQLHQRGIPTYLIGAAFRPSQTFFQWYGSFFRKMLDSFTQIFVQQPFSLDLLQTIGYQRAVIAGDPRLDRVLSIAATATSYPLIARFANQRQLLVAGSTWSPDEVLLSTVLASFPQLYLVIAPHEIHSTHIQAIEQQFAEWGTMRYTQLNGPEDWKPQARVLIVDTIGMLNAMYRYGSIAYIGGAFGAGLHNSLEAAVYGIPLLYGPRYHKFQEAIDFVRLGVATSIQDQATLSQAIQKYLTPDCQQTAQQQLQAYFEQHQGATHRILQQLPTSFSTVP